MRTIYEVRRGEHVSPPSFVTGLVPSFRSLRALLREAEYCGDPGLMFPQPGPRINLLTFSLGDI